MKTVSVILPLSLAANTLLACLWINKFPRAAASGVQPSGSVERPSSTVVVNPRSRPTDLHSAISSWADLETTDLRELIRRLRRVSCPEETIQDMIVAEVNRRYAATRRNLWPEEFGVQPYWKARKNDPETITKNRERARRSRELEREKSALLVDLLGVDPEKERCKTDGSEDLMGEDARVTFLPESKREAVCKLLDDFDEEHMANFDLRNRGIWDSQRRAEQRQLDAERLQALSQILTPQELREYELRQTLTASQLAYDLRGLSVSRDQYEAIFDIRKKYGDSIYNLGDSESDTSLQRIHDNEQAMIAEIAVALGARAALDYKRAKDGGYDELARVIAGNDMPADIPSRVYDLRDAAQQSVGRLRMDATLSDDQRQEAFRQIRSQTEQAVKNLLGDELFGSYVRGAGAWISSIGP